MQKKTLIALALLFSISKVSAASPSPLASPASPGQGGPKPSEGGSPSPVSINEVTDNLKKRLQESLDTVGAGSSRPELSTRAYVGTVRDVIKDTIVIEDKDGKKDIKVQEDTVILRAPGNTVIKQESVRIDDAIIAIGMPTDETILSGKRLIVSTDPFTPPKKTTAIATIKKIDKTSIALTVGGSSLDLSLSSKTIVKSTAGILPAGDLAIGDTIIYTAINDDDGEQDATIIMRIKTSSL